MKCGTPRTASTGCTRGGDGDIDFNGFLNRSHGVNSFLLRIVGQSARAPQAGTYPWSSQGFLLTDTG